MRLMSLLSALTLAVAFVPGSACAADWYLGASGGSSSYGSKLLGGSSGTTLGYDLFAGYRLSPRWALELSYFDMGSADANKTVFGPAPCVGTGCAAMLGSSAARSSADTDGFALSMVGTLPFGDTWSGFVTFGAADSRTDVTPAPLVAAQSISASKWVLGYGVGLQADAGSGWAFRLGWRTLSGVGKSTTTGSDDVSFLFLSALYSF